MVSGEGGVFRLSKQARMNHHIMNFVQHFIGVAEEDRPLGNALVLAEKKRLLPRPGNLHRVMPHLAFYDLSYLHNMKNTDK